MDKIIKNLAKIAVALTIIGIGSLLFLIIFDISYPHIAFRILAPVGVFSVIIAAILYLADYLGLLYKAARKKDWHALAGLILVGIALLYIFYLRSS